jgi:CTP synthase
LGAFSAALTPGSLAAQVYGQDTIVERHRHRYEVNMNLREPLKNKGFIISGVSADGALPEIGEWRDHPWFIGVQFHQELTSRPLQPHPLFVSFIRAALSHQHHKLGECHDRRYRA